MHGYKEYKKEIKETSSFDRMNNLPEKTIIKENRMNVSFIFLASIVMTVGAVYTLLYVQLFTVATIILLIVIFFGVFSMIRFGISLFFKSRSLVIDHAGITIDGNKIRWGVVDNIFVLQEYNVGEGVAERALIIKTWKQEIKYDLTLYNFPPEKLARIIEGYKWEYQQRNH